MQAMNPFPLPFPRGRRPPPSTDSLSRMLAQAVHSEDQKLMEEVLRVSKEKVVMATVRRLPVTCVIPFLKHVSLLLHFRTKSIQLQNLENCLFLNILLY